MPEIERWYATRFVDEKRTDQLKAAGQQQNAGKMKLKRQSDKAVSLLS